MRRGFVPGWIAGLLVFLASCGQSGLELAAPPQREIFFDELKKDISRLRGLPFQRPVELETKTADEIRGLLERSAREETQRKGLSRIYKALGLIPEDLDLDKALVDLRLFESAIHYDPQTKSIIGPKEAVEPRLGFLRSPQRLTEGGTKQLLLVHALTRALQEQHFRVLDKLRQRQTLDRALALRAVMEGDAVLVGLSHLAGKDREKTIEVLLDQMRALRGLGARVDHELPNLPKLFRDQLSFQYLDGAEFVFWALSLKGWEGVNRLFSEPPESTEQILHPEKYFARRDPPLWLTPWSLIREFGGRKILEETLGEFLIRSLLSRWLEEEEAKTAASGWAGDILFGFEQGDRLVLAWVTAWDDRSEALEFYRSYRKALEKLHGVALEQAADSETVIGQAQSGRHLLLELHENFVFHLDGIPAPASLKTAQELWKELQTGSEPAPLELVKAPGHRPAR